MVDPAAGAARDLLTVDDLTPPELHRVLDVADALKAERAAAHRLASSRAPETGGARAAWREDLRGASVGLLFEKPSTRTRISFDVAVRELGGHPVVLPAAELQLGRGETIEDTARVLSGYLQAVVLRTFGHDRLERFAAAADAPVVNALSDAAHPCQALADLQTVRETLGRLEGVRLAYVGDGNNVAHSLLRAGAMAGMAVVVACPPAYAPDEAVVEAARRSAALSGGSVAVTDDPREAVAGASVVYTDVWTSMGQEADAAPRTAALLPYRVDAALLAGAADDAIVLHCLPAHRGEEIAADVLDGPRSRVWAQAGNRLHTAKAVLLHLLAPDRAAVTAAAAPAPGTAPDPEPTASADVVDMGAGVARAAAGGAVA